MLFLSNKLFEWVQNSKFHGGHTADFYSKQSEYGKTTSALDLGFAEFKAKKQKM